MIEASHIKKSLWTKIKYKYWDIMKQIRELEELMDEKAEEMLKRLAAVRLWMWT